MAVEIKELVIRAEIDYGESSDRPKAPEENMALSEANMEAIIRACVKQVLKILKQSRQR